VVQKVEADWKKWQAGYAGLLDQGLRRHYDAGRKRREEKEHDREEFAQMFALGMTTSEPQSNTEGILEIEIGSVFPGPYVPMFQHPLTMEIKLVDQLVGYSSPPPSKVDFTRSRTVSNEESNMSGEDTERDWSTTAEYHLQQPPPYQNPVPRYEDPSTNFASSKENLVTKRVPMGYGLGIFRDHWDIKETLGYGGKSRQNMAFEDDYCTAHDSDVESTVSDAWSTAAWTDVKDEGKMKLDFRNARKNKKKKKMTKEGEEDLGDGEGLAYQTDGVCPGMAETPALTRENFEELNRGLEVDCDEVFRRIGIERLDVSDGLDGKVGEMVGEEIVE